MVDGVVIAGIVILCVLAVTELVYIFIVPSDHENEADVFTVLVYRREDENFDRLLKGILRQRCWQEDVFFRKIYVVHMDVPDDMSEKVREICSARQDVLYMSAEEFVKLMTDDKNSAERHCILSKKIV